ncbi:YajG family lipoprotein [Govanella unica]|uniref:YajG family lipoprotein n=1 Tax=Govanella unica TaxID=2975056 RepID=A0A9X3TYY4_9PROT|nr:YajG family lipoprotein [Govania unica]MDA5193972.1 YajG family lipoprotein [Govania unica]
MSGSFRSPVLYLFGLSCTLGACAYVPQTAQITPRAEISQPPSERAATAAKALGPLMVALRDERSRKLIGHRADVFGSKAAIQMPPGLLLSIGTTVTEALRRQGYDAALDDKGRGAYSVPVLRISFRDLSYDSKAQKLYGFIISAQASFAVRLSGEGRDFEQFYRAEKSENAYMPPTAETNDRIINAALDEALAQVLGDPELQSALSSCGHACRN